MSFTSSFLSKKTKKTKKKKTKERMKERDTQRKVNLHAFFLNLKLASKIWKVILIVGKWSGLKYNYNETTYEYIWFSTNEIKKKSKWLPAIPPDPLIHLFVSFASCFFCCLQTSMSVPKGFTIAVPMPFATIQRVLLLRMQARIHWEWPRMQRYMQTLTFVHIKLRGVPMKELSDENVNALQ